VLSRRQLLRAGLGLGTLGLGTSSGLAVDRCLSHLGALEGYRPRRILVTCQGDAVPDSLLEHLRAHPDGIFAVA